MKQLTCEMCGEPTLSNNIHGLQYNFTQDNYEGQLKAGVAHPKRVVSESLRYHRESSTEIYLAQKSKKGENSDTHG